MERGGIVGEGDGSGVGMATPGSGEAAGTPPPIAIVFDDRCLLHMTPDPRLPEQAVRILSIFHRLRTHGVLRAPQFTILPARLAAAEDIAAVHSEPYWSVVAALDGRSDADAAAQGGRMGLDARMARSFHTDLRRLEAYARHVDDELDLFDWTICNAEDTYAGPHTPAVAALSAGGVCQAVDALCAPPPPTGGGGAAAVSAFTVLRPPGHHCHRAKGGGFCFLNNVAIAMRYAQRRYGVGRVAIVDWDVHHGDGTQDIVNASGRDDVLFISLHRHDGGAFYPGTGAVSEVGPRHLCVNIPWPGDGIGDAEYMAAFRYIVLPMLREFNPDMIFVSSGFDAALGDPLGGLGVTGAGYYGMTAMLAALDPPAGLIVALEGGYNLCSIGMAAEAVASALQRAAATSRRRWLVPACCASSSSGGAGAPLTDWTRLRRRTVPCPPFDCLDRPLPPFVHPDALHTLTQVASVHAVKWACMAALLAGAALRAAFLPDALSAPGVTSSRRTVLHTLKLREVWACHAQPRPVRMAVQAMADAVKLVPDIQALVHAASPPGVLPLDDLLPQLDGGAGAMEELTASLASMTMQPGGEGAGVCTPTATTRDSGSGQGGGPLVMGDTPFYTPLTATPAAVAVRAGEDAPSRQLPFTGGGVSDGAATPDVGEGDDSMVPVSQCDVVRVAVACTHPTWRQVLGVDGVHATGRRTRSSTGTASCGGGSGGRGGVVSPVTATPMERVGEPGPDTCATTLACTASEGGLGGAGEEGGGDGTGGRALKVTMDAVWRSMGPGRLNVERAMEGEEGVRPGTPILVLRDGWGHVVLQYAMRVGEAESVGGRSRRGVMPAVAPLLAHPAQPMHSPFHTAPPSPPVATPGGTAHGDLLWFDGAPAGFTTATSLVVLPSSTPTMTVDLAGAMDGGVGAGVTVTGTLPMDTASWRRVVSWRHQAWCSVNPGASTPTPCPSCAGVHGVDYDWVGGDGLSSLLSGGVDRGVLALGLVPDVGKDAERLIRRLMLGMREAAAAASPSAPAAAATPGAAGASPSTTTTPSPSTSSSGYVLSFTDGTLTTAPVTPATSFVTTAAVAHHDPEDDVVVNDATTPAATAPLYTCIPTTMAPWPTNTYCLAHIAFCRASSGEAVGERAVAEYVDRCVQAQGTVVGAGAEADERARVVHHPITAPRWVVRGERVVLDGEAVPIPTAPFFVITAKAEDSPRQIASLTKCLTYLVVVGIADALQRQAGGGGGGGAGAVEVAPTPSSPSNPAAYPAGLDTLITVSKRAAGVTGGTKADLTGGEVFTAWDLLHGMLLPSGNDAAMALAEHYGQWCDPVDEAAWRPFEPAPHYATADWGRMDPVSRFVAEMNRTAAALGMVHSRFANPHGMYHVRHHSNALDTAKMITACTADPRFQAIVSTRKFSCDCIKPGGLDRLPWPPTAPPPAATTVSTPTAAATGAGGVGGEVDGAKLAAAVVGGDTIVQGGAPFLVTSTPSPSTDDASAGSGTPPMPGALGRPAPLKSRTAAGVRRGGTSSSATAMNVTRVSGSATTSILTATGLSGVPPAIASTLPLRPVRWSNTNELLPSGVGRSVIPGLCIDGVKTGFTPDALACLAIHATSEEPSRLVPPALASGGDGGSTMREELFCITLGSRNKAARFVDNRRVLEWGWEAMKVLGDVVSPGSASA